MEIIPPAPVIPLKDSAPSPPPSDPPRPLGPEVYRLIWLEPRVRRWWLLGGLIVILFLGYAGDRLYARSVEGRLIRSGITLQAQITGAENKHMDQPVGPGDVVQLKFIFPDKSEDVVIGQLTVSAIVGGPITVHIDPLDHTHWTDRSQPTSLLDSLLVGMLVLPLVPIVLAVGYLKSRKLVNIWENGLAISAVIFDRKQSPIAPMSYAVRCSLANGRNKELFTVFVPRVGYGLEKGDLIWVMTSPKKGPSLAALWMAGGSV